MKEHTPLYKHESPEPPRTGSRSKRLGLLIIGVTVLTLSGAGLGNGLATPIPGGTTKTAEVTPSGQGSLLAQFSAAFDRVVTAPVPSLPNKGAAGPSSTQSTNTANSTAAASTEDQTTALPTLR